MYTIRFTKFLLLSCLLTTIVRAEWQPVQFTNPELRAKGTLTGDGCQWPQTVGISHADGNFMIYGTDVGGIFRSLDGGSNWEPTNVGYGSRGTTSVAFDPHNPDRVLMVAGNSVTNHLAGIYLSTDKAASWQHVYPLRMSGFRDYRRQIAFDPSTYDAEKNLTAVAYWSRRSVDRPQNGWGGTTEKPGFMKSEDGGVTWNALPGGEKISDAEIAIHPEKGFIYAGTPDGLYISRDGGYSWSYGKTQPITSVAVSADEPDYIWFTTKDQIYRSIDSGKTFSLMLSASTITAPDSRFEDLSVAPSDASRIILWRKSPNWNWPRFTSSDGGLSWQKAKLLKDRVIVPSNTRQALNAIHPTNPDIILSTGGDYPTLSKDGGLTYTLAGNGVNNILISTFNFSTVDPNVIFLGSQDYATLLSLDGGENWKYSEPGNKGWGGFNYSAYASTADCLIVGEASAWKSPRYRAISFDQGDTWEISDQEIKPTRTYGDPRDPRVLFAGKYRSQDGGKTWKLMNGIDGVRKYGFLSKDLYGVKVVNEDKSLIKRSSNNGKTWKTILEAPGKIFDIAIDEKNKRVFVVCNDKLYVNEHPSKKLELIDTVNHDQMGYPRMRSVDIDPYDPNIVYITGHRDHIASNCSPQRSMDGGKTWENLNLTEPLKDGKLDGGRESICVRVHPATREVWFSTSCYGVWKYIPEYSQ